jgi:hypothetical protein
MSLIWNDLDDHESERERLLSMLNSSGRGDENPASELKDELHDLWDQSYWKQRQWSQVSPFLTHASAE